MTIKQFGEKYRVRVKRDSCGEDYVVCGRGQIYEHGSGKLGVLVISEGKARVSVGTWGQVRREFLKCGFELRQNGDREGSMTFDGGNEGQCRCAMRLMKARKRRRVVMTAERLEVLARARRAMS